jgi:hypothetical protein
LNHKTQHCPRYGPWYPEPGKTREDYAELAAEIADKVAADILAEHEGHDHVEAVEPMSRGGRPRTRGTKAKDAEALTRHCPNPNCLAVPDQWCTTQTGRQAEHLHKVRYNLVEEEHGHVQPVGPATS